MPETLLRLIEKQLESMDLPAGSILVREGEAAAGVWVLRTGKLQLSYGDLRAGDKAVRSVEAPATLGMCEVLSGAKSTFSAVAETACNAAFFEKHALTSWLRDDPAKVLSVLQAQCEEVDSCYDCMRSLATSRTARVR